MQSNTPHKYLNFVCIPLRITSHTSQWQWMCNCEGPWFSSRSHTRCLTNMHAMSNFALGLALEDRPNANFGGPWNIIHTPPCRNPCDFFIHGNFFGPLGLYLLLWSELGQYQPFWPMRDLRMHWWRAFNLSCEVALRDCLHHGPLSYPKAL